MRVSSFRSSVTRWWGSAAARIDPAAALPFEDRHARDIVRGITEEGLAFGIRHARPQPSAPASHRARGADPFLAAHANVSPEEVARVWKRATEARAEEPPRGDELALIRDLGALLAKALQRDAPYAKVFTSARASTMLSSMLQ